MTSGPLFLMLLLFAAIFFRLSSARDGDSSSCDTCEDVDVDVDEDGEDSLNSDQMATLEAQMLKSIEESIPAEAKAAIARRDVLWFGLGAVNFELMPSKEQLEEMAQEVVLAEQEQNTASGSNDGDVSKQHHSLIILFGMGIIAMLILVGSFMVANAYFSRMALKNRARAAEGRFRGGGGGGGHREESTFFRAPSSVNFSTD